jgi:hypothetical protein
MYPLVILGVVSLVIFILLQAINRNDMFNAGVSLLVGVIITYFIAFLRMSDKRQQDKRDQKNRDRDRDDEPSKKSYGMDYIFWLNPNY